MKLFFALVKLSFQRQLSYRTATLSGLATNLYFGLLRAMVIIALYGVEKQVAGITLSGAITYTGISQAAIAYLSLFGWYDLMNTVSSGEVGSDLLKPMGYLYFWMAQDFGRALFQILGRSLPILLFYAWFFDLTYPASLLSWLNFISVLLLAWLVSFAYRFLINLAGFWIPNAFGVGRFFYTLSWFFSGFLMPLRFLPTWFQRICYLTPFPHTINTIVETYLGVIKGPALQQAIINQILWACGLLLISQLVLQAGVRRLVIQGG